MLQWILTGITFSIAVNQNIELASATTGSLIPAACCAAAQKANEANARANPVLRQFEKIYVEQGNDVLATEIGKPLVETVREGFNGTLLAYGQ